MDAMSLQIEVFGYRGVPVMSDVCFVLSYPAVTFSLGFAHILFATLLASD